MSKQWGHGNLSGQIAAMKSASSAVRQLQDREVYAMALVHQMMNSHPDKALVEELHAALRATHVMWGYYASGFWHGSDAGMYVNTHPPMSKRKARETLGIVD